MPDPTPPASPKRADAARNRDKILAAARAAFAESGAAGSPPASMAEVSRRAGVGMATLYRHFPDRRALLEALYTDEVDVIVELAAAVAQDPPGAALATWLRGFSAFFTNKRGLASELLEHPGPLNPVFDDSRARAVAAGGPLLAAAQEAGDVRADLSLEQVLRLVTAVAKIEGDEAFRAPILQAALDGLRPPAA